MKKRKLREVAMSILKYPGGKENELPIIIEHMPEKINNYFEPFVGGGAVYMGINASQYYINDKSTELIQLYNSIKTNDKDFFLTLKSINHNWCVISEFCTDSSQELIRFYKNYRNNDFSDIELHDKIDEFIFKNTDKLNGMFRTSYNYNIANFFNELSKNLFSKIKRMRKIEQERKELNDIDIIANVECSMKSALYMHYRYIYNHLMQINESVGFSSAIYLFIRDMCYSSMFRYNSKGEFNVPYGGISYNKKTFDAKIKEYKNKELIEKLNNTTIGCDDFNTFLKKYKPKKNDFVFLDPPYDTDFSTYSNNAFGCKDQERLANYLINDCLGKFMLIIKKTEFISSLYPKNVKCRNEKNLNVEEFEKKYLVSFKNRNKKDAQHLLVTNY